MENKSTPEIKLVNVINQLQDEIISHNSRIMFAIHGASDTMKNLLADFKPSDEKDSNDEFLVKIPKSKYYEILQFMGRLSSPNNIDSLDKRISDEKVIIEYKNNLIKKLKY